MSQTAGVQKNRKRKCENCRSPLPAKKLRAAVQPSSEPVPFLQMMGTETVDIYVGRDDEKRLFRVYKKVLCDKVPYFDKMFNGQFKEGVEGVATMPEDHPDAFDLFMGYLYLGTLRPYPDLPDGAYHDDETLTERLALYSLAEKLCLPLLMDMVMDMHIAEDVKTGDMLGCAETADVYRLTGPGSGFRKYSKYCVAHDFHSEIEPVQEYHEFMAKCPDFSLDFLKLLKLPTKPANPHTVSRCEFHCHHKMGEPCLLP